MFEALTLDADTVNRQEEDIRDRMRDLDDEARQRVYALAAKQTKAAETYAMCNYIFIAGLHHFYLGRTARGLVNLAVFILGLLTLALYATGVIFIIGITIVELPALFRSQTIVKDHNNKVLLGLLDMVGE